MATDIGKNQTHNCINVNFRRSSVMHGFEDGVGMTNIIGSSNKEKAIPKRLSGRLETQRRLGAKVIHLL